MLFSVIEQVNKKGHGRVNEEKANDIDDHKIVTFCSTLGMTLYSVDPYAIPRFRLELSTINYGLLICKALYIQNEYDGNMSKYIQLPPKLTIKTNIDENIMKLFRSQT